MLYLELPNKCQTLVKFYSYMIFVEVFFKIGYDSKIKYMSTENKIETESLRIQLLGKENIF